MAIPLSDGSRVDFGSGRWARVVEDGAAEQLVRGILFDRWPKLDANRRGTNHLDARLRPGRARRDLARSESPNHGNLYERVRWLGRQTVRGRFIACISLQEACVQRNTVRMCHETKRPFWDATPSQSSDFSECRGPLSWSGRTLVPRQECSSEPTGKFRRSGSQKQIESELAARRACPHSNKLW